mmetsp:Transcript_5142/g.8653  ORF Transcript_5142/g.8653 Transcript_5142/m.8653 type:complete len:164 (-) Transcript_5142:151-642(-)
MLLNVRLEGSDHVGELQLHLQTIIDIKESAHRTYALMRSVGWEDDSLEKEGEQDDGQDEEEGDTLAIVVQEEEDFEVKVNPLHVNRGGNTGDIEMASIARERGAEGSDRGSMHQWSTTPPQRRHSLSGVSSSSTPAAATSRESADDLALVAGRTRKEQASGEL